MEAKRPAKEDAVASSSTKPDLKRKHQELETAIEENAENLGPIPIVKLEVVKFSLFFLGQL